MSEAAPGPTRNNDEEGQQQQADGPEGQQPPTRASATASCTTGTSTSSSTALLLLSTDAVCHQLRTEFENMRRALTCSICLSTYRDAVILSNCVHAYCRGCIVESIQHQSRNNSNSSKQPPTCPLCHAPCGRRSITAQPDLNRHAALYKAAVRRFGLAPVRYAPHIAMTQQQAASSQESQQQDSDDGGCRDEWWAARTFARALRRERERPGGAALLEEQEQVLAVNAQQVVAAAAAAAASSGRHTVHGNLPDPNDPKSTPSVAAAAPHSNNDTPGIPTYSQIQAQALSQLEADRSLLEESDEEEEQDEEEEFYSACDGDQIPTQLTTATTTGEGENNNNNNNNSRGAAGATEHQDEEDDDDFDDDFDDHSTKIATRHRSFDGSDEDDDGDDETKIAARRSAMMTTTTMTRRPKLPRAADDPVKPHAVLRAMSPPAAGVAPKRASPSPNQQQPQPPHPFSAKDCSPIEHCASQELVDDKTPQMHNHRSVRAMVAAMEPNSMPRRGSNSNDSSHTRSSLSSTSTKVLPVRARVAALEGQSRRRRRRRRSGAATSSAARTSSPASTGSRSEYDDDDDDEREEEQPPHAELSVAIRPQEKKLRQKQSTAICSGGSTSSSKSIKAPVIGAAGTTIKTASFATATTDEGRSVAEEESPTGRNLSVRDRMAIFERTAVAAVAPPASSRDRMQEDEDDDEGSLMAEAESTTGVAVHCESMEEQDSTAAVAAACHAPWGAGDADEMMKGNDDDDDEPGEEHVRKPAAVAHPRELHDHLGEQDPSGNEANERGNSTAERLSNQHNSRLHVDTSISRNDDDNESKRDGSDTDREDTTTPTASCGLTVGTVVDVQSRTWPGVNQLGGVAKIIKVHTESDGSILYDVQYVLDRRKEKKVDAVFVSLQEEIDSATKEESVGRRPRSTRHAEETATAAAAVTANNEIPAELLSQLKREGFDVEGKTSLVVAARNASSMIPAKESKENSRLSLNADRPQDRNPAARTERIAQKTEAMTSRGRKRKSSVASICTTGTLVATKRKKFSIDEPKPDLPASLPHWSIGVQCKKADDFYRRNINAAIKKGVVSVCTSFLSEPEEKGLKELCRHVKTLTPVRITVSELIQPSKTTICVLPAGIPSGCNLTAERRSLKAMQASVLGIPIVSPSWIAFCLERKKVAIPEANMYVRTLPTKTAIAKPFSADFGVSFLAAAKEYSENYSSSYSPFRNCSVYLLGFSSKNGTSFGSLLREAGADVITNKQSALAKLKALNSEADDESAKKIVIMCDANVSITDALEREVSNHSDMVAVVNSSWLVDSISCGVAVNPSAVSYEPQGAKAKDLWKLTRKTCLS